MKKLIGLFAVMLLVAGVNAQNSKKIKVVNLEAEIEASCDKLPGSEIVEFSTKCKDGGITVDYTDKIEEGVCVSKIERTYAISDACGNTAIFSQLINVKDTESPKFLVLPPNLTFDNRVDYINSPHVKFPQVSDNCSADISLEEKVTDDYSNGLPKLFKTYIAKDGCGNKVSHTQEITFNINQ